jgi:hypothetical protein
MKPVSKVELREGKSSLARNVLHFVQQMYGLVCFFRCWHQRPRNHTECEFCA